MLNPPYVHHVAVTPQSDRPAVRLAAAARGDGAIAVYDADAQVRLCPRDKKDYRFWSLP